MTTNITTLVQTIFAEGVENVVITAPVLDQATGKYVRELRLEKEEGVGFFSLRLSADTPEKIKFTVPTFDY